MREIGKERGRERQRKKEKERQGERDTNGEIEKIENVPISQLCLKHHLYQPKFVDVYVLYICTNIPTLMYEVIRPPCSDEFTLNTKRR